MNRIGCSCLFLATLAFGCSWQAPPVPEPSPVAGSDNAPPVVTNSIGMRLTLIPAGVFRMGSPDSDPEAKADEKP